MADLGGISILCRSRLNYLYENTTNPLHWAVFLQEQGVLSRVELDKCMAGETAYEQNRRLYTIVFEKGAWSELISAMARSGNRQILKILTTTSSQDGQYSNPPNVVPAPASPGAELPLPGAVEMSSLCPLSSAPDENVDAVPVIGVQPLPEYRRLVTVLASQTIGVKFDDMTNLFNMEHQYSAIILSADGGSAFHLGMHSKDDWSIFIHRQVTGGQNHVTGIYLNGVALDLKILVPILAGCRHTLETLWFRNIDKNIFEESTEPFLWSSDSNFFINSNGCQDNNSSNESPNVVLKAFPKLTHYVCHVRSESTILSPRILWNMLFFLNSPDENSFLDNLWHVGCRIEISINFWNLFLLDPDPSQPTLRLHCVDLPIPFMERLVMAAGSNLRKLFLSFNHAPSNFNVNILPSSNVTHLAIPLEFLQPGRIMTGPGLTGVTYKSASGMLVHRPLLRFTNLHTLVLMDFGATSSLEFDLRDLSHANQLTNLCVRGARIKCGHNYRFSESLKNVEFYNCAIYENESSLYEVPRQLCNHTSTSFVMNRERWGENFKIYLPNFMDVDLGIFWLQA